MEAEAVERLGKELDCAVCMNTLNDPKCLSCFHAFCKKCLQSCADVLPEPVSELKCPMCREVTRLPAQGVEGLKSSPLIDRVLDVLKAKRNSEQLMCDSCGDTELPLSTYCRDCLHFICTSCTEYHSKMKLLMKNHRTVSLSDIQNGKVRIKWAEEGLAKTELECEEHIGELRRFYCKTCKLRICRDCIVLDHTKPMHECTTMQKRFREIQVQLGSMMQGCKEKEDQVNQMINDVTEKEEEASRKLNELRESILASKTAALMYLEEAETELTREVDALESAMKEKIKRNKDQVTKTKNLITSTTSKAKEAISVREVVDSGLLPENILTVMKEVMDIDIPMSVEEDLQALKCASVQSPDLPEKFGRFANVVLPNVWTLVQKIRLPSENVVKILCSISLVIIGCREQIYSKPLHSDPDVDWNVPSFSLSKIIDMSLSRSGNSIYVLNDNSNQQVMVDQIRLDDLNAENPFSELSKSKINKHSPFSLNDCCTIDALGRFLMVKNNNSPTSLSHLVSSSHCFYPSLILEEAIVSEPALTKIVMAHQVSRVQKGTDSSGNTPPCGYYTGFSSPFAGVAQPTPSFSFGGFPDKPEPFDTSFEVLSVEASKTGRLVFLRKDKKAVIITDEKGVVENTIKEIGRMYVAISCFQSDSLFVLSAFWGSHTMTLAKHSLEDGRIMDYIVKEIDMSKDLKGEWPTIGNYGNDRVIMNVGNNLWVYNNKPWDILEDHTK